MTKSEALERMKILRGSDDQIQPHIDGDEILCELLITFGCEDVVEEYRKIRKWYE